MAYPVVPAAYGLKPVSLIGGRVFAGSTRLIPISYNYGYNLFNGDVVGITSGALAVTALGAASSVSSGAGAIGVFVGAQYVNSSSQTVRAQYYPANTTTSASAYGPNSMQGYVVDDPQAVFQSAVLTQGSSVSNTPGATIGYVNPSFIGSNMYLVTNGSNGGSASGNTSTGDSAMGVTGGAISSGTQGNTRITTSAAFRVVAVVPDTAVTVVATGGNGNSSGTTVTLTAANTAISPGMQLIIPSISGAYAGQYLTVTNVSSTTVTLSASIAVPNGTSLSFVGYPEVQVTWNFGYHNYFNATGN
jgi:hypothetical protein